MFEVGKYKKFSNKEIQQDLEREGFKPLLIIEDPNDYLEAHTHPESHILVVVDGEMKVKLKDEEIIMRPGDKITLNSEIEHAAFFGSEGCKYFWVEY